MNKQDLVFRKYEKIHKLWPWPKPDSNKSITWKDTVGTLKVMAWIVASIIVFFILKPLPYGLLLFIILFVTSFYFFASRYIVYAYNLILSSLINTPPVFPEPLKKQYFPEYGLLESPENWQKIRNELDQILITSDNIPFLHKVAPENSYIAKESDTKKGWRIFALKYGHKYIASNCEKAPYLTSLLKQIPNIRACFFSILDGHKHIPLHTGYFKGLIRYHLAMIVPDPENTFIMIHGKKYHWQEGKGFIFDDIFPHEVYNHSDQRRVIIYMDLDRKLPEPFNILNKFLLNVGSKNKVITAAQKRLEQPETIV